MSKSAEKETKEVLKYRLQELDRQQLVAFCSFVSLHGASFYTLRDKLVYGTDTFCRWEEVGLRRLIQEFMPDYQGTPEDFFDSIDEKTAFVQFMVEKGGMGRTTVYQRFKLFKFKKWEVEGLLPLFDRFMETTREE